MSRSSSGCRCHDHELSRQCPKRSLDSTTKRCMRAILTPRLGADARLWGNTVLSATAKGFDTTAYGARGGGFASLPQMITSSPSTGRQRSGIGTPRWPLPQACSVLLRKDRTGEGRQGDGEPVPLRALWAMQIMLAPPSSAISGPSPATTSPARRTTPTAPRTMCGS